MKTTRRGWFTASTVVAGAVLALAPRFALGDPPSKDVTTERYNLSPSYVPGQAFRATAKWKQTTYSTVPQGFLRPTPPNAPSDYDGGMEIDSTVTIDKVDARGGAEAYSVHFDVFRVDVPNPVQSKEYRDRMREQKQKNLPENAHPLEGSTIRYDATGAKVKIFRVLASGEDFDVTKRYPEVVPILQDLVDPDWTPVDSVFLGGEWEMNADHLFRLTRVVARAPIKGTIKCRLLAVIDGVATIAVEARILESYAKVDVRAVANGTITFDVAKRKQVGSTLVGEVSIGGDRTGLRGTGSILASKTVTDAESVAGLPVTPK